jgi:hypothetical protein
VYRRDGKQAVIVNQGGGPEGSQSEAKPRLDGWSCRGRESEINQSMPNYLTCIYSLGLLLALLSGSFGSAAICPYNIAEFGFLCMLPFAYAFTFPIKRWIFSL